MKKVLFLFAIITIIAQSNQQKAFGSDCKFLCDTIIDWQESGMWKDSYIDPDNLNCRCEMDIYWSYRYVDCPDLETPWCDFKIDSVKFYNCYPSYCNPVLNKSLYELTHLAASIIVNNIAREKPCYLELKPGECTTNISINFSSCWKTESYPWNYDFIVPCESEHCCREIWQICYKSKPTHVATIGINHICPDPNCIAVCEEYNPPPTSVLQSDQNYTSEFGDKIEIYPNPTDIRLYINYNSISEGLHTFEVYDLTGNLVYSEDFNKSHNDIRMQFNFTKLTNGAYNFVIKSDGTNRINGKFNIIK